jgi:hypothetical protein
MKIKKISTISNQEDAIMHIFTVCRGDILSQLIPVEYNELFERYKEIKAERSKPKDLPGQQTFL